MQTFDEQRRAKLKAYEEIESVVVMAGVAVTPAQREIFLVEIVRIVTERKQAFVDSMTTAELKNYHLRLCE